MIQRRRHVFHIAGYDPVLTQQQYRRFNRQLEIFRRTWNVEATCSELSESSGYPSWAVSARGPNWQADATYEILPWDDIVRDDARGSELPRLLRGAVTYLDLLLTGTIFRYGAANTRYLMFALFPLFQIGLLAFVAWYTSHLFAVWMKLDGLRGTGVVVLLGLAIFWLLMKWPGRRWRIQQALDDWILSRDYISGRRADVEARLDCFAERLVARVREGGVDEIVLVGHSLGATFAIDLVARALEIDPAVGQRAASLSLVTVGATIPKCTLHPAARRIRERVARVVSDPTIFWTEYQARADAISFYRFDPVSLRKREKKDRLDGKPVIRLLQIQDALRPETFAKYRYNVLRLHYQFVSANDRRAPYDYFMMICGPLAVGTWATSTRGLLDFFEHPDDAALTAPSDNKLA